MAENLYIGLNNVARKSMKGYIGVSNIARRIKKIYTGDANGKAKPVFAGTPTLYIENKVLPDLAVPSNMNYRIDMCVGSIANHAVFSGGNYNNTSYTRITDVYTPSLTKYSFDYNTFIQEVVSRGVGSNSRALLFVGGRRLESGSFVFTQNIGGIDNSLTALSGGAVSGSLSHQLELMTGTRLNDDYAMFAGGQAKNTIVQDEYNPYVYAISKELTVHGGTSYSIEMINVRGYEIAAGSVGNQAVFAGGRMTQSSTTSITVYNSNLTKVSTGASLSVSRCQMSSANAGNYLLFAGGRTIANVATTAYNKTVDAYNSSMTRHVLELSTIRDKMCSGTLDNVAYFIGGYIPASTTTLDTIESFDASLTRKLEAVVLPESRGAASAANAGNYLLVAGGQKYYNYQGYYNSVIPFGHN